MALVDVVISESDIETALEFLEGTCEQIAAAKAELERSVILCKRIRKRVLLGAEGTLGLREATAEVSPEVADIDERYISAVQDYEALKAKRELMQIKIDVWRTAESSRRAGRI